MKVDESDSASTGQPAATGQPVKESSDKVATTSEEMEKPKEKKEPPKEIIPAWGNPGIVLFSIGVACLVAIIQQEDIAAGRPGTLFEPHVVPAPQAGKSEVVIQFCQS